MKFPGCDDIIKTCCYDVGEKISSIESCESIVKSVPCHRADGISRAPPPEGPTKNLAIIES